MIRLYFAFFTLFSFDFIRAQNPNDNCENAIDITSEIFYFYNYPEGCSSSDGTAYTSYGFIDGYVDHPTVDAPVYSSQECNGYKAETTDEFPDLWYKSSLHENVRQYQKVFFFGGDTIEVAVYYGQCGALYQSQCFTLTYADSIYWEGAEIEYLPHHSDDDIYIQIKVPPNYNDYISMCFSDGFISPIFYSFSYNRPAGTNGISQVNSQSSHIPLRIYPNPVTNWIHFQSDNLILSYSIADIDGKVRLSGKGNLYKESVDLSDLQGGFYVITVLTETGMGINKIFKL